MLQKCRLRHRCLLLAGSRGEPDGHSARGPDDTFPQDLHGDVHRSCVPESPGFRKRDPSIERGHCGERRRASDRPPATSGRHRRARRPRGCPTSTASGLAAFPCCRAIDGRKHPSGRRQPPRRRRCHVTSKSHSAAEEARQRLDSVTAVALPAMPAKPSLPLRLPQQWLALRDREVAA